jgi:hypothetical protein
MLMLAAMQAMVQGPGEGRVVAEDEMRVRHPWDRINLTKSERREKTYDELQAMRKAKWEASR